jgi:ABC-type uncharacterized transport system permease subunit
MNPESSAAKKKAAAESRWGFPSGLKAPAIAIGAALAAAMGFIVISSGNPLDAIGFFFSGPLSSPYFFGNMLNETGGLILTGLGVALAFRSGCFNLGGEGQAYAGGFVATMILLAVPVWPGWLGIAASCLAAAAAGALVAGISGYLRARYDADELISSFLISSALLPVIDYLVSGPLRDPGSNLLATKAIAPAFRLPSIMPPSHLNAAFILAVLLAVGMRFLFSRTVFGFELRITGGNREFARAQGINPRRYYILGMAGSGAFHALAGALAVVGTYFTCHKGFSSGLGWNGIAVALIAGNAPLAVIPAALVFSYVDAGASSAILHTDFSFEAGSLIQAAVFLFITARFARARFARSHFARAHFGRKP